MSTFRGMLAALTVFSSAPAHAHTHTTILKIIQSQVHEAVTNFDPIIGITAQRSPSSCEIYNNKMSTFKITLERIQRVIVEYRTQIVQEADQRTYEALREGIDPSLQLASQKCGFEKAELSGKLDSRETALMMLADLLWSLELLERQGTSSGHLSLLNAIREKGLIDSEEFDSIDQLLANRDKQWQTCRSTEAPSCSYSRFQH